MMEKTYPRCPMCGSEADWFYRMGGETIGCSECVERVSYQTIQEEQDGEDEYLAVKRYEEEGI